MAGSKRSFQPTPYRIGIVAVCLCGALLTALVFRDSRRDEDARAEAEFNRRATLRHALSRETLSRHMEALFGLSSLFVLEPTIGRAEFASATNKAIQRLPGALTFEWVPIVPREQRSTFESAMRAVYAVRGFDIVEFDPNSRIHRAAERPAYYPIAYAEPLPGNEIILGYDLKTAPTGPYIERARQTGRMMVTQQFRLAQETGEQLGFVFILPIFRSKDDEGVKNTAQEGPVGFLDCVFHVTELLETVCANQPDPVLDVLFVDASETKASRRILHFHSGTSSPIAPGVDSEEAFRRHSDLFHAETISMGDREWQVLYRPHPGWLGAQHSWTPTIRSGTMLALTALLAGLVSVIGRRTDIIRREVDDRTAELAESRRQYANLLHALPGMAFRASYENGLVVRFVSEGAFALTGWTAEEIMSGTIHVRNLVHKDDIQRVRRETLDAIREHRDYEAEYRIRTRGGDEKWVLSRGRGVYDSTRKLEVIEGIVIDITAGKKAEASRLELERKLLETQKLESLGLLAGGIAHDFNNLLSAILGNASLARMSLPAASAADPQLRAIETASLRAAELCRQMLAYAGKGRFVVERIDLSAIVEDLLPLLRVSIARTAVLHLELSRDLPGVKADPTQIRQIVMNLVLNAVDALSSRPGEITLRTEMVEMDKALLARCVTGVNLPLGTYVGLHVSDTGCGMSAEMISKIFEPFFTTKFAGRGLGLAAVLGIVRGHNGALLVESEPDQGSTFRLFLPAIAGEVVRVDTNPPMGTSTWHRSGEVLVIDDEEPVRVVLVEFLKTFGFTAHAVADGRSGVDLFKQDPTRWELVIVDLLMPGLSGEDTLAALRAIVPDVRVLLVSGFTDGDVMNRVPKSDRIAFLPKPFKRDLFGARLQELFTSGSTE